LVHICSHGEVEVVVMLATCFLVEMSFYVVCPVHSLRIIDWNISTVATHEPSAFVIEFEDHQSSSDHTDNARDSPNSVLELESSSDHEVGS
jgi:hypothetical protein